MVFNGCEKSQILWGHFWETIKLCVQNIKYFVSMIWLTETYNLILYLQGGTKLANDYRMKLKSKHFLYDKTRYNHNVRHVDYGKSQGSVCLIGNNAAMLLGVWFYSISFHYVIGLPTISASPQIRALSRCCSWRCCEHWVCCSPYLMWSDKHAYVGGKHVKLTLSGVSVCGELFCKTT